MTSEPTFRRDLYRGTAADYDNYRLPYPRALLDDLCRRAGVGGGGRLLDLACGTGQVAFGLAGSFDEVWAVDQEAESVAFGRAKSDAQGVTTIRWIASTAEDAAVDGPFDLITVGNAFHRVRRSVVAARITSWLSPDRCVALLWGGIPSAGECPWQVEMSRVLETWMNRVGTADRLPPGWADAMESEPHAQVLVRAGLSYVGEFTFAVEHEWTVESLVGFAYSTSMLNRHALGDHAAAFEADLAARLLAAEPAGVFPQTVPFAYELARRPGPRPLKSLSR